MVQGLRHWYMLGAVVMLLFGVINTLLAITSNSVVDAFIASFYFVLGTLDYMIAVRVIE